MLLSILLPLLSFLIFRCDGLIAPSEIFRRLLHNYSRDEAPNFPDKKSTEVKLGMYIGNLQYLGDETADFSLSFYMRQRWKDPRLSFTTTDGKDKSIKLPENSWKQIWLPDTFIRDARSVRIDDDFSSNRLVKLSSTGEVFYVTKITAIVPSQLDLTKYPFDRQILELHFESFGHTKDTFYFSTLEVPVDYRAKLMLPQFNILNTTIHDCSMNYTIGNYPCLQVDFHLERRSKPFVLQFYLPSILIVILSWLAFWIDLETSSKSRLFIGVLSTFGLIFLNAITIRSAQYGASLCCWMIACYFMVFGSLVQFAVVKVLSKITSGARGLEYLKPPFATDKKAIEAENGKQVCGSGGDGNRKVRLVDWFSRILFPAVFLLVNLIYWIKLFG